ncbi:MAG: hypothetical protein FOGNACKC_06181 [Anaerolineae bacterium]|nr:hypothetical protein [Anaerolineae bacterium]
MKVVFKEKEGQTANFIVLPTSDREIIDQFVDYETGYLIVLESNNVDLADRSIYCTVIDPNSGKIIDAEMRAKQIDTKEKVTIDERIGLKVITQRTIDPSTGQETIHEKLINISTQEEISSSREFAFNRTKRETILEAYHTHREQRRVFEKFWSEEYPKLSFEERKAYWFRSIYRSMRDHGEIGYDEYTIFNRESYKKWIAREPNFDPILDYVIKMLSIGKDEAKVRDKVNQLLGKSV